MKKNSVYITIFAILLFSVILNAQDNRVIKKDINDDNNFIIWSLSDIQPRSENEKKHYETAIDDTGRNLSGINMTLCAGDIVQKSDFDEIFKWYSANKKKLKINEWFEIAGNHEWRAIDLYRKYINDRLYYSVEKGNLLILLMSNEASGRKTFISDKTFRWWEDMVKKNQDKIIITVTHGALEGSGLAASRFDRLTITDSERFAGVLKNNRVDIWISGHSHFPGWFPRMEVTNSDLGGTTFIDNGAIRNDFYTGIESQLLYFTEGSSSAIMKRRGHKSEKFLSENFIIPLSHPFSLK